MAIEPASDESRVMSSDLDGVLGSGAAVAARGWVDGIDVFEHHCIDFASARAQGVEVAVVRAGRGTRQDARWIEHVRAAYDNGVDVGSYWHLYPSRTDALHQAELWAAAIRGADVPFGYGHWADISSSDGFERGDLGGYVASFLRRTDELLGEPVGVFASPSFWRRHVGFDDPARPHWTEADPRLLGPPGLAFAGVRLTPSDRGGPGRHRVRLVEQADPPAGPPRLAPRGRTESDDDWRSRWDRTSEIAVLQMQLNDLGARLVVDGVFGPQTDAAVRGCDLLCRRDRLAWPFGTAPAHAVDVG
jgi:hypothetical protein